MFYFWKMVFTT